MEKQSLLNPNKTSRRFRVAIIMSLAASATMSWFRYGLKDGAVIELAVKYMIIMGTISTGYFGSRAITKKSEDKKNMEVNNEQ